MSLIRRKTVHSHQNKTNYWTQQKYCDFKSF